MKPHPNFRSTPRAAGGAPGAAEIVVQDKGSPKTRDARFAMRSLAVAVREGVPAETMVDWHVAILEGHNPTLYRDSDGNLRVNRGAINPLVAPTLDQKTSAMKWLAERGYGLPAQSIQVQGELTGYMAALSGATPLGALSASTIHSMREVMRRALGQSQRPAPPVIDVGENASSGAVPVHDDGGQASSEDDDGDHSSSKNDELEPEDLQLESTDPGHTGDDSDE